MKIQQAVGLCAGFLLFMGVVGESTLTLAQENPASRLSDIPSFEVDQIRVGMQVTENAVHPELTDYLTRALVQKQEVPVKSPAQGIIHLSCKGLGCGTIILKVTDGKQGPVVWQTSTARYYALRVAEKDDRKIAQTLADALGQAYQHNKAR